jgi:hypothetical protein
VWKPAREHDLSGAFKNCYALRIPLFKITLDVLDRNGGIVHENADSKGQPTQGHNIDGLSHALGEISLHLIVIVESSAHCVEARYLLIFDFPTKPMRVPHRPTRDPF